jgi:hypothetical protein
MGRVQGPFELDAQLTSSLEARVIQVADQVVASSLSEARQVL